MKRVISLLLALTLALTLALPASAAEKAKGSTLALEQASGTVEVKNASGKKQTVREKMKLYSGYSVSTGKESEAYISLDESKVIKLTASTKVSVQKSGKQLEVALSSGEIFFNVTQPLKTDETLNIRSATMVTGIRGTYGWATPNEVGVMYCTGVVTVLCRNPYTGELRTTVLQSGERVYFQPDPGDVYADPNLLEIDFVKELLRNENVPRYVVSQMAADESLCTPVEEHVPNIDVPALLDRLPAMTEAEKAAEDAAQEQLEADLAAQEARLKEYEVDQYFDPGTTDSNGGVASTPTPSFCTVTFVSGTGYTMDILNPDTEVETVSAGVYRVPYGKQIDMLAVCDTGYSTRVSSGLLKFKANGTELSGVDAYVDTPVDDYYLEDYSVTSDTTITAEGIGRVYTMTAPAVAQDFHGAEADLYVPGEATYTTFATRETAYSVIEGETVGIYVRPTGSDYDVYYDDYFPDDPFTVTINGVAQDKGGAYGTGHLIQYTVTGDLDLSAMGVLGVSDAAHIVTIVDHLLEDIGNEVPHILYEPGAGVTETIYSSPPTLVTKAALVNGTLQLDDSVTLITNAGSELVICDGATLAAANNGVLNAGGTVVNNGTISMPQNNSQIMVGAETSTFINNGSISLASDNASLTSTFTIMGGSMTNNGTINVSGAGGLLQPQYGASVTNSAGASIVISDAGQLLVGLTGGTFNNAGTINITGTGQMGIVSGGTVTNSGTITSATDITGYGNIVNTGTITDPSHP